MRRLECAQPVETALAGQQPVDRDTRERVGAQREIRIVLGAGDRVGQAGDKRFQRVLCGVER